MALIWLLAGEASGDVLGARLMAAIEGLRPGTTFAGVGGPLMEKHGLRSLFPMRELSLMGFAEVLPKLPRIRRLLHLAARDIAERRPAAVVTIDSPGFALRLLRAIGPLGVPRAHYVAPQVWAWRERRVRKYPGLWERLLCLLPFEPEFFARHGLPATFVGHPVLESGLADGDGARFRARHGIAPDCPLMIVMPGSRAGEIARLGRIFGAALARLGSSFPTLRAVVPAAPDVVASVRAMVSAWPLSPIVIDGAEGKADAFAAAHVALCKSGTSSLELAFAGVPMVVAYRVNPLSAALARRLIKVPYASLVNLLAGCEVVPELIQESCTPERIARTIGGLLADASRAEAQRAAFPSLLGSLAAATGTPSLAAARVVLELLE